jgi:hypothetical protein
VKALCEEVSFPVIDFPTAFFRAGVSIDARQNAATVSAYLHDRGYAYLGARTFWCRDLGFDFSRVKKILLVRDPRDAIISWYFSAKKSHGIPKENKAFKEIRKRLEGTTDPNQDLEFLVSRAKLLAQLGKQYRSIISHPNTVVYRYEDVIFRKRLWLADVKNFLELKIPFGRVVEIADQYDQLPRSENASRHVRQVYPGNHIKHFSPDTIRVLDSILDHYIRMFRYDEIERFVAFTDPAISHRTVGETRV